MPMRIRVLMMGLLLIAYIIVCFFTLRSWYKDDVSEFGETVAKAQRRQYIKFWSILLVIPLGTFIYDFQLSIINMVACMSFWYTSIFTMLLVIPVKKGVIKSKLLLIFLCLLAGLVFAIFAAVCSLYQ